MVLFRSPVPDVEIPKNVGVWEWLFEDESSPLQRAIAAGSPLGAVIDAETHRRYDWGQIKSNATALSACLVREYGLRSGDTVTLFSNNTIWYYICMHAVLRAGGRINGAPPAYTIDEMAHALRTAETKLVIVTPAAFERARKASELVGIPNDKIILTHSDSIGIRNLEELVEIGSQLEYIRPWRLPKGKTSDQVCGFLSFSSGTTGLPKAVMLSHYNIIAQCCIAAPYQAQNPSERAIAITPLYHITGTWKSATLPIRTNIDIVILPVYSLKAVLEAIVNLKVEDVTVVPPIALKLARDPLVDQYDLRHIKGINCGAAPLSKEILKSLEARFPWIRIRQGYGATECSWMSTNTLADSIWGLAATNGKLVSNTIAKVVDPEGNQLGPNQIGEFLVKGPQVAMGYLNNPKATRDTFDSEGFYHTGDAVHIGEDGLIHVADRIKELIKVKGHQVPPAELEDLLLGHPAVKDCAVVGIPDEYAGELPKAFVTLKPSYSATIELAEMLKQYVKDNKVRYKWLHEIEFIEEIPKSAAGKILRRSLRERSNQKLNSKSSLSPIAEIPPTSGEKINQVSLDKKSGSQSTELAPIVAYTLCCAGGWAAGWTALGLLVMAEILVFAEVLRLIVFRGPAAIASKR